MGSDWGPAVSHGISGLPFQNGIRVVKTIVKPKERLAVGIIAVNGGIHTEQRIVVAAFAVFGFVVDRAAVNFHFADVIIALEIGHIIGSVPEAEFHKGEQFDLFGIVRLVPQHKAVYFAV